MKINVLHCNAATVAAAKSMYERAIAQLKEERTPWDEMPLEYQSAWCAAVHEARQMMMCNHCTADYKFEATDSQLHLPVEPAFAERPFKP